MHNKNHSYKSPLLLPHQRRPWLNLATLITTLVVVVVVAPATAATDADTLMRFKLSLSNATALDDWDPSVALCAGNSSKWTGLTCVNGNLYGLRLENMGLGGTVDVETLAQLPSLRSLSVANNSFEGPFPAVKRLGALRALYLSDNRFSGAIPGDGFGGMKNLKKVYLARNGFVGKLPKSLVGLRKLMELDVQGNGFEGKIPRFSDLDWKILSFANNLFRGRIPESLSKIDQSAFSGNKDLCGAPLGPCKSSKKSIMIIVIVVSLAILVAALALVLFLKAHRARSQTTKTKLGSPTKVYKRFTFRDKALPSDCFNNNKKRENGSLHFVKNDREKFELEDLLRASAEVLGSGNFGSSYKAILFSGPALVVKRFRYMNNVGRDEFEAHMTRLGRLAHPNILSIIAYYYTKEEKLLISNFVENGSLASHLHGKRAEGQPGLNWPTRLKMIKGVSKGLSYLYKEFPDQTLPHGHLKSSNVLLDRDFSPLLSDYALAPLVSKDKRFMVSHRDHRISRKTDVWSLGTLILELLTGKFPANYVMPSGKQGGADLAAWVDSVVREEWTGEVFDKDMGGTKRGEGQMLKMLKIGLCCCENNIEKRWDWRKVAEKIEEVKERDNEEDVEYESYVTDWDVYSSMVVSDEKFSFSVNNDVYGKK